MNEIKEAILSKFGIGNLISYANIRIFEIDMKYEWDKDDDYERYYWSTILKKHKNIANGINGEISPILQKV